MNLLDLIFKYDIKIVHQGDYDGGCYDITLTHETTTQQGCGEVKTEVVVKQDDINEMYEGALKLAKVLKEHVYGGY